MGGSDPPLTFNPFEHLFIRGPLYDEGGHLLNEDISVECDWCNYVYVDDSGDMGEITAEWVYVHMSREHPEKPI